MAGKGSGWCWKMGSLGPCGSPSYSPVGSTALALPGRPLPGPCSDLDVELNEGGTSPRPAWQAASGPTSTAQQLLAEV